LIKTTSSYYHKQFQHELPVILGITKVEARKWFQYLGVTPKHPTDLLQATLRCTSQIVYHGKKGFVIPTKSFVKIGITKIFCYNKMFSSINKSLVAAAKFLVEATKIHLLSLILLP